MSHTRDSSPVYYREIQKNAYLKRLPNEVTSSKALGLRPLGLKKAPIKPLWTQLCIHNGRTPYLEQYRDPTSARAHRPIWRASLLTARHVTASVTPRDNEYDFLVDTQQAPVRMLAPDWDTMQDWVTTLRSKLHELKILPLCENVYCAPPTAPVPRAAARDPTSPLPATPAAPPDRVPGIDLTPILRSNAVQNQPQEPVTEDSESSSSSSPSNSTANVPTTSSNTSTVPNNSRLNVLPLEPRTSAASSYLMSSSNNLPTSNHSAAINTTTTTSNYLASASTTTTTTSTYSSISTTTSTYSSISTTTSTYSSISTTTSIDYSTPKMALTSNYSLIAPQVSLHTENIDISSWDASESNEELFQSLPSTSQVNKSVAKICGQNICLDDSIFKRTNESDDDDFLSEDRSSLGSKTGSVGSKTDSAGSKMGSKQGTKGDVNSYKQTVVVSDKPAGNEGNSSGDRPSNITVIQVSNKEPPHTAIPIVGPETDVFDFDFKTAPRNPNYVNIVNTEVNVQNSTEYGTVFTKNEPEYGHLSLTTTVNLTEDVKLSDVNVRNDNDGVYEKLCLASTSKEAEASPLPIRRLKNQEKLRKSSLPNIDAIIADPTYEYLFLIHNNNNLSTQSSSSDVSVTSATNTVPKMTNVVTTINNIVTATSNYITTTTNNVTTTTNNVTTTTNNVTTTTINNSSSQRQVTSMAANVIIPNTNTSNITLTSDLSNARAHVNTVPVVDPNTRAIWSSIERSNSQSGYDVSPRREARREHNISALRNGKVDKIESVQTKPIWKRGLTELSLLTRLRGITHGKRQESPDRQNDRAAVTSPVKVVHRSRPEARMDRSRRRSSSLTNGQSPPSSSIPPSLIPLRARQAAALYSEQCRGAALVAPCRATQPPVLADYNKQVWIAWWGAKGVRFSVKAGDRVCGVRGVMPKNAAHAKELLTTAHAPVVDILFHRVPLGKIYVVNKRDQENTGIKIDSECNIGTVDSESPAAIAGIPPPGKWAITEVNNRPINLLKVNTDDINRLTLRGTEASILIQPSALVKKLRAAIKSNKTLLDYWD